MRKIEMKIWKAVEAWENSHPVVSGSIGVAALFGLLYLGLWFTP
jgi:hypothetical protein